MRIVAVAGTLTALGAIGALAVAFAQVGTTVMQLRALDLADMRRSSSDAHEPSRPIGGATDPHEQRQPAAGSVAHHGAGHDAATAQREQTVAPEPRDAHIAAWLAADPEFQRAADELLHDPDPEVQEEAGRFLYELGVAAEPER